MKAMISPIRLAWQVAALFTAAGQLVVSPSAPAQVVATIRASDADASEPGTNPGQFIVTRTGDFIAPLTVSYLVAGTASNGVDYAALPGSVTIPAGAASAPIKVEPLDDALVEGTETVELRLVPSPTAPGYAVGTPGAAAVFIRDDDVDPNLPPLVTIQARDPGAAEAGPDTGTFTVVRSGNTNNSVLVFYAIDGPASNGQDYETIPNTVLLEAGARAADITIKPIDDDLAEGPEGVRLQITPSPMMGPIEPYRIGVPSNAVVTIADNDRPANEPPHVQINQPADGAVFTAPTDIVLAAYAQDRENGQDLKVEFFAGAESLGLGTFVPALCPAPYCPFFALTWSNVPPGQYLLTAKATDRDGASSTSPPVRIAVLPPNLQPVVTITTLDEIATEIPLVPPGMEMPQRIDPAVFLVSRTGETDFPLTVFYSVAGTAENGKDYEELTGSLTIPVGARAAPLEVVPIDDALAEGRETVIVRLKPPVCIAIYPPPRDCYLVGRPDTAQASIVDDDPPTNRPPQVTITAPPSGAVFRAPADIGLAAVTLDPDGYAPKVEFFANDVKIGEQEIVFIQAPPPGQPIRFELHWSNVVAGAYVLTAVGTDNQGAKGVSAPVRIAVVETNGPPTNPPPMVSIIATDPFASEGVVVWASNTVVGASVWCTNRICVANGGGLTNCPYPYGTNLAVFTVRRQGPTNADLTVRYTVGGTASNGVDYVELPGVVTIPAGRRSVSIVVRPIEDTLPEQVETVILTLQAASDPTTAWQLGYPRRAAAYILDNDQPRPPCRRFPDGLFHLVRPGLLGGGCYRVDVSVNLVDWTEVCTSELSDGAVQFVDPDAPEFGNRFYRVVPVPCPPRED